MRVLIGLTLIIFFLPYDLLAQNRPAIRIGYLNGPQSFSIDTSNPEAYSILKSATDVGFEFKLVSGEPRGVVTIYIFRPIYKGMTLKDIAISIKQDRGFDGAAAKKLVSIAYSQAQRPVVKKTEKNQGKTKAIRKKSSKKNK